jgi:hypothetical protein
MLRNIPSAILRKLVVLSERKDALMSRIQDIEQDMLRLQRRVESAEGRDDKSTQLTITRPGVRKVRRQQTGRGELKQKIVSALRSAGKQGITIANLSKKLRVKRANLYVWFNGTGRKIPAIKKVGPAKYRLSR